MLLSALIILFIIGHIFTPQLRAEETPCEPCATHLQDVWNGPYTHTTSQAIPGTGCTLDITYWTRICTATGEPQIKIGAITPQSNCSTLTAYSAEEIAIMAMGDLLQSNPMNFAPTTVGAPKDWAIVRPACWKKNLVSGTIEGCTTDCCTSRVTAELFDCNEQTTRGLTDKGYSTNFTPSGPLEVGCSCKCENIFKRYRDIMGKAALPIPPAP